MDQALRYEGEADWIDRCVIFSMPGFWRFFMWCAYSWKDFFARPTCLVGTLIANVLITFLNAERSSSFMPRWRGGAMTFILSIWGKRGWKRRREKKIIWLKQAIHLRFIGRRRKKACLAWCLDLDSFAIHSRWRLYQCVECSWTQCLINSLKVTVMKCEILGQHTFWHDGSKI